MIGKKEVEYVAKLAKIDIDDRQKDFLAGQLSKILDYIDKLKELDVEGVEPMRELNASRDVLRKDEAKPFVDREDILNNAPLREGDYFKIPRVIE
jgi:aspartyl-tRNA(Asn)/glutamyl-tRNA(Gln) amidotransferase subunit C